MLDAARTAADRARADGNVRALAAALREAGRALAAMGREEEALGELRAAERLCRESSDPALGVVLEELVPLYHSNGDDVHALQCAEDAIQRRRTDQVAVPPRDLLRAAELSLAVGETVRASGYASQSLVAARAGSDRVFLSDALSVSGRIAAARGKHDDALAMQREAHEAAEEAEDQGAIARALEALAQIQRAAGKAEQAHGTFLLALQMRAQEGDEGARAAILCQMGDVLRELGMLDEALDAYLRALPIAEALDRTPLRVSIHRECAMLFERIGAPGSALTHLKRYIALTEGAEPVIGVREPSGEPRAAADVRAHSDLESRAFRLEHLAQRSQINPHFLHNALNSIQFFLTNSDRESALRYLAKLARLTRATLENVRLPLIPLSTELDTIALYLDLERLRFTARLGFDVTIDEEISPDDILIPPMVLQPFVENAVLHGILPKSEGGGVTITVTSEDGETMRCVVLDDGIGREESRRRRLLTGAGPVPKISLGIRLIADRLALLQRRTGYTMSVDVQDVVDAVGSCIGTRVELVLPLGLREGDVI